MNANNELGDMDTNNMGLVQWDSPPGTQNFLFSTTLARNLTLIEVDTVLNQVNGHRVRVGALTNRLEGVANNLQVSIENLSAAESRFRNTDVAAESAELVKQQILQQAATSVLAQANQSPNIALQLLKNN